MSTFVDTIVVGGGQAGLSASWHLKKALREHVVLDRGSVGDTWRRRWDSFCLVTPNWCCKLPGFPYDGDEPEGFMLRDDIVRYVERFAASFDPPYRAGVDVRRVSTAGGDGRFVLETSAGQYCAHNLIVAAGTHQHPNIPAWDAKLPDQLTRLHTSDYRNPGQLLDGGVLVVGSGQSGCQVAEDLLVAGRDVHLCVGNAGRIPRRYRGRDILEWSEKTGALDLTVDNHPKGEDIRFQPQPHVTGRNGGHTIDLRQLALDGIQLHGRLIDVDGSVAQLGTNLVASLEAADEFCRKKAAEVDDYVAKSGMEVPTPDLVAVEWKPETERTSIDLTEVGISTIIYATGFHPDFSWIDLPVLNERGYPRYERGVTDIPGLYFVGLHWMHTPASGLFYGVGRDAEYVVGHLADSLGTQ